MFKNYFSNFHEFKKKNPGQTNPWSPRRLIRIIDLSPKRDSARDNPWPPIPVPRIEAAVYRSMLSRKRIHGWMVGRFSFTRSSSPYECIAGQEVDGRRIIHCHAFRIYRTESRISVMIRTKSRPNISDERLLRVYVNKMAVGGEARVRVGDFESWISTLNSAGWNARFREIVGGEIGYIARLCCNNDVMEERRIFPNSCPRYGGIY